MLVQEPVVEAVDRTHSSSLVIKWRWAKAEAEAHHRSMPRRRWPEVYNDGGQTLKLKLIMKNAQTEEQDEEDCKASTVLRTW